MAEVHVAASFQSVGIMHAGTLSWLIEQSLVQLERDRIGERVGMTCSKGKDTALLHGAHTLPGELSGRLRPCYLKVAQLYLLSIE